MRRLLAAIVAIALVPIAFLALFYAFQRKLLFVPDPRSPGSAEQYLSGGRDAELSTDDGLTLSGWYLPASAEQPVFLVLNGNAGNRALRVGLAQQLAGLGAGVLLFDYRGYGGNPGSPSENGLIADARAAQSWLVEQGVEPGRIIYFGESLGAAVAIALAAERPPRAMVLRSPFYSGVSVAEHHFPWLPVQRLMKDPFRSDRRIADVSCPILFVAGSEDRIVPSTQRRRLFEVRGTRWLEIAGADHNDADMTDGSAWIDELATFLSEQPRDLEGGAGDR